MTNYSWMQIYRKYRVAKYLKMTTVYASGYSTNVLYLRVNAKWCTFYKICNNNDTIINNIIFFKTCNKSKLNVSKNNYIFECLIDSFRGSIDFRNVIWFSVSVFFLPIFIIYFFRFFMVFRFFDNTFFKILSFFNIGPFKILLVFFGVLFS